MDRHEPQVHSTSTETEVTKSNRVFNGVGNFLRDNKNKLAATAAAAALTITLAGCGANAQEQGPEPTTTTSQEEDPSTSSPEGMVPPANAEYVNDPEITDENAAEILAELEFTEGMTPEEIGKKYTEIIDRWGMAGATPDTYYAWLNDTDGNSPEDIAHQIATRNAAVYATALFGENYEATANSTVLDFIKGGIVDNESYINYYMTTYSDEQFPNTNSKNKEVWSYSVENLNNTVKSDKDGILTLIVRQKAVNNASMTLYSESRLASLNGYIGETTLTIDMTQGKPRIIDWSIADIK